MTTISSAKSFFCSNVCQWLLVSLGDPDGQIVSMDAVIAKRGNQSSFYCSNQNIIALSTSFPTTKLLFQARFELHQLSDKDMSWIVESLSPKNEKQDSIQRDFVQF